VIGQITVTNVLNVVAEVGVQLFQLLTSLGKVTKDFRNVDLLEASVQDVTSAQINIYGISLVKIVYK